jgi:hypothetical protein
MARKNNAQSVDTEIQTAVIETVETPITTEETMETATLEITSELPATVQSVVNGDASPTTEEILQTAVEELTDEPGDITIKAARQLIKKWNSAIDEVNEKYGTINKTLEIARQHLTEDVYVGVLAGAYAQHGLTGDVTADAHKASGITPDELAAANDALRNPLVDFLNEVEKINQEDQVQSAFRVLELTNDRISALASQMNVLGKISNRKFYIDQRVAERRVYNDEYASRIEVKTNTPVASSFSRTRNSTPKGDALIANLDFTVQKDGADWHLTTQGDEQDGKWRLQVVADGVTVYEVLGTSLHMQGPNISKPTLNQAVNAAAVALSGGNSGVQRSVNQVFNRPVYANQVGQRADADAVTA